MRLAQIQIPIRRLKDGIKPHQILVVMLKTRHPVAVVTKGALIERDIDLLAALADQGLTRVGISVTSLVRNLSRRMEPRAPDHKRRLRLFKA